MAKWTKDEIKVLNEYYPNEGVLKCCEMLPHRTKRQIKAKTRHLGIKSNHYEKWTDEEEKMFKIAWETYSLDELLKAYPNRSYEKLCNHATVRGYHSQVLRRKKTDLSFLDLENLTPQNSYWWGFIMADGHLSKRDSLIIDLKNVDEEFLKVLAIKTKGTVHENNGFSRLTLCGKILGKWREMLDMKETAKTYFPPNLKIFEEFLIYFFIGFVDGDGCIWFSRNYPSLKIELHVSWVDTLKWIAEVLKNKYQIESVVAKVSSKNTAVLSIGNRFDIVKISQFCKETDYMKRKWDKVLNYKITSRKRTKTYEEYIELLKKDQIFSVNDAKDKKYNLYKASKRFNTTIEKIIEDLNKDN